MTNYHSGISYFTSDINKPILENVFCQACGIKMYGEKSYGATSWAGAIADIKREHYKYICKYVDKPGHEELVDLLKEIEQFKSERLRNIVEEEFNDKKRKFRKSLK